MEKREIIILTIVLAYAAIRLYQKYGKGKNGPGDAKAKSTDLSSSKDDYEPYSKK